MTDFSKGIAAAVISGVLIVLITWLARSAWNRNKEHLELLETENRELKEKKVLEEQRLIAKLIGDLQTTILAVTKLEVEMAKHNKVSSVVDKLARDIQAIHIWKRIKFKDDGDPPIGNGGGEDVHGESQS